MASKKEYELSKIGKLNEQRKADEVWDENIFAKAYALLYHLKVSGGIRSSVAGVFKKEMPENDLGLLMLLENPLEAERLAAVSLWILLTEKDMLARLRDASGQPDYESMAQTAIKEYLPKICAALERETVPKTLSHDAVLFYLEDAIHEASSDMMWGKGGKELLIIALRKAYFSTTKKGGRGGGGGRRLGTPASYIRPS